MLNPALLSLPVESLGTTLKLNGFCNTLVHIIIVAIPYCHYYSWVQYFTTFVYCVS